MPEELETELLFVSGRYETGEPGLIKNTAEGFRLDTAGYTAPRRCGGRTGEYYLQ